MSKKIISLLLAAAMVFSLAGCAVAPAPESEPTVQPDPSAAPTQAPAQLDTLANGTYEGAARGFGGELKVAVTLANGKISSIEVLEHAESENIGTLAFPLMEKSIVDNQSLADTISGATYSSAGILSAVINALKTAGASDATITQLRQTQIDYGPNPGDTETDIVVVGAGPAGILAAMTANDEGKSVILLEKLDTLGGSSKLSAGAIWGAGVAEAPPVARYTTEEIPKPELYRSSSYDTSPAYTREEMYNFFNTYEGPVYFREIFDAVFDASAETLVYVMGNNVELRGTIDVFEKAAQDVHASNVGAVSAGAVGMGAGFIDGLSKNIYSRNIDLRTASPAVELVQDASGAITGVIVESQAGRYTISAKKVILATGGFTFDTEMLEQYAPGEWQDNILCATPGATGDGHKMSVAAGGELVGEGLMTITAVDTKPGSDLILTNDIPFLVNSKGDEICPIGTRYVESHRAINAQPDRLGYAIYSMEYNDGNLDQLEKLVAEGYAHKADTIAELAAALNVDAAGLEASIAERNKHYDEGTDDEIGAPHALLTPIKTAPFYGYRRSPSIMGTVTGLKVNTSMQVLNGQGAPIENLYAVGELMFGNFFNGIYPKSGTANGMAMAGGRIAAMDACTKIN